MGDDVQERGINSDRHLNIEAILRESENRYHSLFENLNESYSLQEIICDEDGQPIDYRFLDVNGAFERQMGLKRENVVGKTFLEIFPNADRTWIKIYGKVALTREPAHFTRESKVFNRKYDVMTYSPARGQFATIFTDVTERLKNEDALKESEEKFRNIFDKVPVGIGYAALDGHFLQVNSRLCNILGYTEEELLKLSFIDVTFPEDRAVTKESQRVLLSQESKINRLEKRYIRKDGTIIWADVTVSTIYNQAGIPITILGVVDDITIRKREQEDLQTHRAFVQNAASILLRLDLNGKILFMNRYGLKFFGYDADELVGRNVIGTILPKQETTGRDLVEFANEVFADPDRFASVINENTKKNGERVWVAWTNRLVRSPEGKPLEVVVTGIDITQLHHVKEDLQKKTETLEQLNKELNIKGELLDWATDSIFLLNMNLDIVYANDIACESRGYAPDELIGRNLKEIIRPDYIALRHAHAGELLEKGEVLYESAHLRRDGSSFPVEVKSRVIKSGGEQYFLSVYHDLSERKKEELRLRQLNTDLERSNRDLETFAYAASHDLQEPLRTITAFVQLLAQKYRGKLDADADKFIGLVSESSNRMSAMITDLLNYSRIRKNDTPSECVDLNQVLRNALANLDETIKESGAKVSFESLPSVHGDAVQLVQIFQNLIGNGIKYRKTEGSAAIHVGEVPSATDGEIHIYIKDNGIGIDPKHFDKLFVIFHRLHARDKYPGTGVGLAICKKIVERHGGRIWVESSIGQGSTFHFTLKA